MDWVQGQGALQIERGGVQQGLARGVFLDLAPGGLVPLFLDHLVQMIHKSFDFHVRQILLKGQQGVQVGAQQSGQGGQQGNVGVGAPGFPKLKIWIQVNQFCR